MLRFFYYTCQPEKWKIKAIHNYNLPINKNKQHFQPLQNKLQEMVQDPIKVYPFMNEDRCSVSIIHQNTF